MNTAATTLGDLAQLVNGRTLGDEAVAIDGACPIGEVQANQITFIDNAERIRDLEELQAVAVVVPRNVTAVHLPAIQVDDVHAAFARIVQHFRPPRADKTPSISPSAVVHTTARIGKRVSIHASATVGEDVCIGDDCTILPGAHLMAGCVVGRGVTVGANAVLYEDTHVGDRSIIHAGSIVGAYGFGYRQKEGRHVLAAQLGNVEIGADVEIGANATIDRGTYGPTRIGEGTKIDNLVQIAHNCQIGRHNLICSQVGIAGSTTTGDYVVMAGQVGVRDHVRIGTGAVISAMAGISNDVAEGAVMLGIPATPERDQKLKLAALAKLPQMRKEFKEMRRKIAELELLLPARNSQDAA